MSSGSTVSATPCFIGVGTSYETGIVDYLSSTLQETTVKSKLDVPISEVDSKRMLDMLIKGPWCNKEVVESCLGTKAWKRAAVAYDTELKDAAKKVISFINKGTEEGKVLAKTLENNGSSAFINDEEAEVQIGERCLKNSLKHIECDLILTSKKTAKGSVYVKLGVDEKEFVHPFVAIFEVTSDPQQAAGKLFQLEKDLAYLTIKEKLQESYNIYPVIITNGGVTIEDVVKAKTESLTTANLSLSPILRYPKCSNTLVIAKRYSIIYTKHLNIYELEKSLYGKISSLDNRVAKIEEKMDNKIAKIEEGMKGMNDKIGKIEEGMKGMNDKIGKIEEGMKEILEMLTKKQACINSIYN
eukprot:TRINITY_DN33_c0_g1_i6.p2 TRINITY_DN33_c0_g1~~TRINITY_DN33_c0_g1_i6.p2  ORF type:complete len:356 (-),score=57.10 TRINITY_DN33_c0_g1_i6:2801-3868(-)